MNVQYQGTHTVTTAEAAGADIDLELGFVPDKVVITNRTSLAQFTWLKGLPAANFYKTVAAGTRTLVTSGGLTLIDGTDKTANLDKSYGVIIPGNLADFTDAEEILDIEATRIDL